MITNPEKYTEFDAKSRAADHLSLEMKYRILDSLYEEARRFGHFTEKDLLSGLEDDIRLAAILNTDVSGTSR